MSSTNDDFVDVHTIRINGFGRRSERLAAGSITPGMYVELDAADTVSVHSTAGKPGIGFAVEDDLQGNTIDDIYLDGVLVQYERFESGTNVLALLENGETAIIGSKLTSNGNGNLKIATGTDEIIAHALQAVDLSDSSLADPSARIAIVTT